MARGTPFNSETAKQARAKAQPRGESKLAKLIKECSDKEKAVKVFTQLENMATGGDLDAIKLYLSYVIGKPKETIQHEGNVTTSVIFKLDERFKDD